MKVVHCLNQTYKGMSVSGLAINQSEYSALKTCVYPTQREETLIWNVECLYHESGDHVWRITHFPYRIFFL